ncbi:MAG TPA: type II toxin-antitoxin system Phd/YefM family antitoxin [Gemmatimonadaceae bacterium]
MPPDKPKQVNLYEAKTHLSQLVKEAAAGREIIIANAGEPMARLVPLATESKAQREPGRLRGQIWIADDFDDPLPPHILAAFYGEDPDSMMPPGDSKTLRRPKKRKKR